MPDNITMTRLGDTLRRHRIAARLSQEEMASKTEMSQKKYSQIESGKVQDPGFRDLANIGRVLGFTPNKVAELAGLWIADREESLVHDDRWDYVQAFIRRADTAQMEWFLNMAYSAALGAERLGGGMPSRPVEDARPRTRQRFRAKTS